MNVDGVMEEVVGASLDGVLDEEEGAEEEEDEEGTGGDADIVALMVGWGDEEHYRGLRCTGDGELDAAQDIQTPPTPPSVPCGCCHGFLLLR